MKKKETTGSLMLFVTAMIWGSAFLAQQSGMEHIGPFTMQAIRYTLAGLALLPFIAICDKMGKFTKKPVTHEEKKFQYGSGAVCGVLLCAASILQQYGLLYTSVGKSGFITALYIVLVPLIGLLFGRKTDVFTWIYAVIAVVGLYILSVSGAVSVNVGDLLTLGCAVIFALHILKIDSVSGKLDGVRLACTQFFVCAALSYVGMFALETPVWSDILRSWFPIVYAGVMSGGVAYTMQILGPAERAADGRIDDHESGIGVCGAVRLADRRADALRPGAARLRDHVRSHRTLAAAAAQACKKGINQA